MFGKCLLTEYFCVNKVIRQILLFLKILVGCKYTKYVRLLQLNGTCNRVGMNKKTEHYAFFSFYFTNITKPINVATDITLSIFICIITGCY